MCSYLQLAPTHFSGQINFISLLRKRLNVFCLQIRHFNQRRGNTGQLRNAGGRTNKNFRIFIKTFVGVDGFEFQTRTAQAQKTLLATA